MGGAINCSLISVHLSISAYFLIIHTYKRMRLATWVHGICIKAKGFAWWDILWVPVATSDDNDYDQDNTNDQSNAYDSNDHPDIALNTTWWTQYPWSWSSSGDWRYWRCWTNYLQWFQRMMTVTWYIGSVIYRQWIISYCDGTRWTSISPFNETCFQLWGYDTASSGSHQHSAIPLWE